MIRISLVLLFLPLICTTSFSETVGGIDLETLERPGDVALNSQEILNEQSARRSIREALRLISDGKVEAETEDDFSKLLDKTIDKSDVREAGRAKIKEGEKMLAQAAARLKEIYAGARERAELTEEARNRGMMHEWTSTDGRTLNAGFVSLADESVTVVVQTGDEYTIPLERLVKRDSWVAKIFDLGRGFDTTGFLKTIESGSIKELDYYVKAGFEPPREVHGEAFLKAIELDQDERVLQRLIELGLEVNSTSSAGRSPLSHAVLKADLPAVRILLQNEADPLIRDSEAPALSPIVWSLHKWEPVITTLLFKFSEDTLDGFLSSLSGFVSKDYFQPVSLETAKKIQDIVSGKTFPHEEVQALKLSLISLDRTISAFERVMMVKEMRPLVISFHNFGFYRYTIRRNQEFIDSLIEVWKKQHEAGEHAASYSLALAFLDGWGRPKDPEVALQYLNSAIAGGHSPSMILMGEIYEQGLLGEVDADRAYQYYLDAVGQNDPLGMVKVGHCYEQGLSVARDPRKAVVWYERAIESGSTEGMAQLGRCYLEGIGVVQNTRLGTEWYAKAAEANNPSAMFFLGKALLRGEDMRKDTKAGIKWLQQAADFGELAALVPLGIAFSDGTVREDLRTANLYFREAAERGDAEAMYLFANNLRDGNGIRKDETQAFQWYQRAAAQGHLEALNQLAVCYSSGVGVEPNQKKAFDLFERASKRGHMQATANLAIRYANGLGVPVDKDASARLYLQVMNSNDSTAKQMLRILED